MLTAFRERERASMAHSGKDLGVDLYDLKQVAKSDLPTVFDVYGDAMSKESNANNAMEGIPKLPGQFTGDHGSVSENYATLHGGVAKVLKETRDNLHDTARALDEAADLYAETDQGAARELKRLTDDRGEPKPE